MSVFQLTTSRGGLRPGNRQRAPHTYFNSQPHEEVDQNHCNRKMECNISTHDLTRRSTRQREQESAMRSHFNSRPHEEVDAMVDHIRSDPVYISTHDLTRRSTPFSLMQLGRNSISTHDLTRRSTHFVQQLLNALSISTHDLTRRSTLFEAIQRTREANFNS